MPSLPETLFLDRLATPIGELLLVADAQGRLCLLEFGDKPERWRPAFARRFGALTERRDPSGLASALARYFDGDLGAVDALATGPAGTPFQHAVWTTLRKIPAGTTTSYGALAKALGKPAATRAVGLANGANPIAIVVPCHRVLGGNGSLTGYGGGLERKRWLLDHERKHA
ncbi:MAG: methylated-DNA--[protein]-cysteine S-methyltransferase [Rhizomicrobium sp.]